MSDQPRRPVFFWLVLLVCVVYAGLFAFTIYAVARYYGFERLLAGPSTESRARGGLFLESTSEARRLGESKSGIDCLR